jgi:hypothetical protein
MAAATSWKEGKDCAEREGKELVFHNFDTGEYGTCSPSDRFGCFEKGKFIEQRCICMPATLSVDEMEQKERKFLEENPEWAEAG